MKVHRGSLYLNLTDMKHGASYAALELGFKGPGRNARLTNHANERGGGKFLGFGKHTLLYDRRHSLEMVHPLAATDDGFTIKPCHDFPVTIY